MERTEGFILFTVFLVLPDLIYGLTILYAVLVLYTAIQRFQEARKLLKKSWIKLVNPVILSQTDSSHNLKSISNLPVFVDNLYKAFPLIFIIK